MKIHEYQAKAIFREFQIPVPAGAVASTPREAETVAADLNTFPVVVKAQIHAGGRGKGGGVKLAGSLEEVRDRAEEMIGCNLVTSQTGPAGQEVKKVLVEQGLPIEKELYLSLLQDRETAEVVVMASEAGGMDIEAVAEESPDRIFRISVNPLLGIQGYHCREAAVGLNLPAGAVRGFVSTLNALYRMFVAYDCSLVEINPLVLTSAEEAVALDAKIIFDGNALYRHENLLAYRDKHEEDPLEVEASRYNLNYIHLGGKGSVGNMVNGAGLAMATMDLIKQAGAEPANFLDVGGGASAEMVENGFRIILSDPNVKAILINIFGGILRCDTLARGVIQAARKTRIQVPVVVRMEGTNVEEGRRLLAGSGLALIAAGDLKEAARKVAEIAKD